jgi:hypothetical protein
MVRFRHAIIQRQRLHAKTGGGRRHLSAGVRISIDRAATGANTIEEILSMPAVACWDGSKSSTGIARSGKTIEPDG